MIGTIVLFFVGLFFGHFIPRVPWLILPRFKSWNSQFPQHPRPIPVDEFLIQRVLHMRLMHRLTWLFVLIPLLFGWASLKYGIVSIGMGLWLASCWTLVNKLVSEIGGHPLYPYSLAEELQLIRNQNQTDSACCDFPLPVWQIESVKCSSCQTVLMERYRPDLGRPRSDGRLKGLFRLLLTDGYPVIGRTPYVQSNIEPKPTSSEEE